MRLSFFFTVVLALDPSISARGEAILVSGKRMTEEGARFPSSLPRFADRIA